MEFKRLKFPIAAPMFIAIAVFTLISMITSLVYGNIFSLLSAMILLGAYVLLVIDLFMKKRGLLTVIGSALPILAAFINFVSAVVDMILYFVRDYYIYASAVIGYIVQILFAVCTMVCWTVMLLTVFSGIIPARSAAKKDPVVALRTE